MDITARTVFIAGGTAGIGLELARRFRDAGSTVVVGGRRADAFESLAAEGFGTVTIAVAAGQPALAARDAAPRASPAVDTVITMAGIGVPEDLRDPAHFVTTESVMDTNF